jgi:hypothetical protein
MGFRLVRELAAEGFPTAVTCRALRVSRSGYYDWLARPPSARDVADAHLLDVIIASMPRRGEPTGPGGYTPT